MDKSNDALVIGWDFSYNDEHDTVVVMRGGRNNRMKVVNSFNGDDAHAVYDLLVGNRSLKSTISE